MQTRDGYLWVGTFGGLARFDGMHFTVFDIANTEALSSNRILSLLEGRNGDLWIGTTCGGVLRLRAGVFTSYEGREHAPEGEIWSIVEDRKGAIWFGARNLVRYADGEFRKLSTDEWMAESGQVWSLHLDSGDNLWVATNSGLGRFRDGHWRVFTDDDGLPGSDVRFVGEDRQGRLWASSVNWGAVLEHDRFAQEADPDKPLGWVFATTTDRRANHWIGCEQGLFLHSAAPGHEVGTGLASSLERALPRSVTGPDGVRSLLEDREGNIWVGTSGRGLVRLRKLRFTSVSLPPDYRHESPNLFTADNDEGPYIRFRDDRRIIHLSHNQWTEVSWSDEFGRVDTVASGHDGSLWIAHDGRSLSQFKEGRFTHHGHGLGQVYSILETRHGTVWLGMSNGAMTFVDGRANTPAVSDGPPPADCVRLLAESSAGTIWAAGRDSITGFVDGGIVRYTTSNGLPKGEIRSLHVGGDEILWIATYGGGLARLADGKFTRYTTREGLPDNSLGKILQDDDGNLWINSNRGVIRIGLANLSAFAEGRTSNINCRTLPTGEASGSSGTRTPDGKLWFPSLRALIAIDPRDLEVNDCPPGVVIERAVTGGVVVDDGEPLRVPLGNRDIEIQFTGLGLVEPEAMRFRYMLAGHDEDWVEAGTRRTAYFTNLPPGEYSFRVMACNSDGVWSARDATLALAILPHFYETGWFLTLCGICAITAGFVGHWIRTYSIRARAALLQSEVAERKRAEENLQEANSLLSGMIEGTTDAVFVKDLQGRYLMINAAAKRIIGRPHEEVIGKDDRQLFPHETASQIVADDHRVLAEGKPQTFETLIPVGGTLRTFFSTKTVYRDSQGTVIGLIGISRDITDRKQGEEDVRESEARFRQLAENINQVFWLTDWKSKELIYVSPAYERVFGRTCRSLYENRMSWLESIHPDDRERVAREFRKGAEAGRCVEQEYRILGNAGETRWVLDRAFPILDSAGVVDRVVGLAEDITERKSMESAVRDRDAELAHVARLSALGEMASGLAHELNQPLAAIASFAAAGERDIRDGSDDLGRVRRRLTDIGEQVDRAGQIIRGLRTLVRRRQSQRSPVSIEQCAKDVLQLLQPELRSNGIRVRIESSDSLPRIEADGIQIQQVFLNLIRNASEAMQDTDIDKRSIVIRLGVREDNELEVSVCDSGHGISPEHSEKLFEPFFTTKENGLGMGLSISRSIVLAHGGQLSAKNNTGRGMTFRIRLPIAAPAPA